MILTLNVRFNKLILPENKRLTSAPATNVRFQFYGVHMIVLLIFPLLSRPLCSCSKLYILEINNTMLQASCSRQMLVYRQESLVCEPNVHFSTVDTNNMEKATLPQQHKYTRPSICISLNKNGNYCYLPRSSKHTDTYVNGWAG